MTLVNTGVRSSVSSLSNRIRRTTVMLTVLLMMSVVAALPVSGSPILDQINSSLWHGAWTNIQAPNRFGQTFTPTLPWLVAVEVDLLTGNSGRGGDTVTLTIFDSGGNDLVSVPQSVGEGFSGFLQFVLPTTLAVIPGSQYSIQLQEPSVVFGWKYGMDTYSGGTALSFDGLPWGGIGSPDAPDFFFKTYGLPGSEAVPEPATLSLLPGALAFLLALRCWRPANRRQPAAT